MPTLLVSLAAGVVVAAALWAVLAPVFEHPMLARTNLHGRPVATAGGLVVALAVLVPVLVVWVDAAGGREWVPVQATFGWSAVLTAALGFGFLGLVDDLLGDGSSRGFKGHLAALRHGRLTTGGLKLFGGGVVALLAVGQIRPYTGVGLLLVDGALVALAANLANLFDRAPGRVTKLAGLCTVLVVVAAPTGWSASVAVEVPPVAAVFVVGAAFGVLVPELREQVMLGDTGANVIGAALGLAVVGGVGSTARMVVAVVLLALNLASERVSFSRVIASTPLLRQLDQLGRARR